jgi:hypothetical protein
MSKPKKLNADRPIQYPRTMPERATAQAWATKGGEYHELFSHCGGPEGAMTLLEEFDAESFLELVFALKALTTSTTKLLKFLAQIVELVHKEGGDQAAYEHVIAQMKRAAAAETPTAFAATATTTTLH